AVCTGCATSANGCVQRFPQRRALQPAQCVRGGGQGAPAAAGGASCRLCAAQSRGQGAGENISQRVVVITSRPAAQPEHAVIQQRRVIQAAVDDSEPVPGNSRLDLNSDDYADLSLAPEWHQHAAARCGCGAGGVIVIQCKQGYRHGDADDGDVGCHCGSTCG